MDGVRERRPTLPFRYYGTTRIDVLPADRPEGTPDWELRPASIALPQPPPANPWLFPFDFVLEAGGRLFGERQFVATIAPAPTPPELRVERDIRPTGIDQVRARADAARIAR
ncbi:MAG: hypothetical protein KDE27_15625 [Planctomycetes bacterium]|nr:hypothetical protein [Planctomycetota bacterium]